MDKSMSGYEAKAKYRVIIDTDLGDDVDDAAALIMALNSPEIEIAGITTVFHDTRKRAEMVLELCRMYGREDIPVYAGCGRALIEDTAEDEAPIQYEILREHEEDRIRRDRTAWDFIVHTCKEDPDVIILALGMMTNLAMAFLQDSETMKKVRIVGMGGVFTEAVPEWNIKCDPEAARIVTDRAGNLPLFGLDVTKYSQLTPLWQEKLSAGGQNAYFWEGAKVFHDKLGYPFTFHDALLIGYLLAPEIADIVRCDYTVELRGELTRGAIIKKVDAYVIEQHFTRDFYYASAVDMDRFFEIVGERLHDHQR